MHSSKKRAKRDKKDFLSGQCKEIEKNNRMGKIRDIFKKIRDTKGICKDGHNKEQKWYGPNKKQKILRRSGKNIQKNCTKEIFMTQRTTMV